MSGPTGSTGPTGGVGAFGAPGATGPTGTTGPTGLQGPGGVQGLPGEQGPVGPTGSITAAAGAAAAAESSAVAAAASAAAAAGFALDAAQEASEAANSAQVALANAQFARPFAGTGPTGPIGPTGPRGATGGTGPQIAAAYGAFLFSRAQSTLSADATSSDTTISITVNPLVAGFFFPSGSLLIGSEVLGYTGIFLTTFTGVTRGIQGSTAAAHVLGSAVTPCQTAAATTPTRLRFGNTLFSQGVSLVSVSNDVLLAASGSYVLTAVLQVANFVQGAVASSMDAVTTWFVVSSAGDLNYGGASASVFNASAPLLFGATSITSRQTGTFSAGSTVQVWWACYTGQACLASLAPQSTTTPALGFPQLPAAVLTVVKLA